MLISAEGKSQGKLCSLEIDLNASKQIAPQAAASPDAPGLRVTFMSFPRSSGGAPLAEYDRRGRHPDSSWHLSSNPDRRIMVIGPICSKKEPPMLTREENELVTRIGPGTPMGDVMR